MNNPTELLVLGSAHLNTQMPDSALQTTIGRLAAWQPQAVAIEVLAGEVVQGYRAEGGRYIELRVGGFQQALKLEAVAKNHRHWTRREAEAIALASDTFPAERVLAWLVALEPVNAVLHWTPALDLPADVAQALAEYSDHKGEILRLAVPVAAALGLPRLYGFDDFTNLHLDAALDVYYAYWGAEERQNEIKEHRLLREHDQHMSDALAAADYWNFLRYSNSPRWVADSFDLEVGAALRHPLPAGEHRARIADWDSRNLFMAARLRGVTAQCPGGRVLALAGAGHKGPLEKALMSLAPDVRLVELAELEGY